jgi:CRP-like cAMP-binding protein
MFDLSAIPNARLLEGLTQTQLLELGEVAQLREARQGECLITRGEPADTIYLVRDGRFALTVALRDLSDEAEIAIEELETGGAFGWSALVAPQRSIYSVYCLADGSVAALSGEALQELMASDTGLGHRFCSNLSELIGRRLRIVQNLWIAEVEQSTARVRHWEHSAMEVKSKQRSWRDLFAGGRSGDPSDDRR